MTEVFEVERILASKKSKGKILYKVRWKTFGPEEDTWEPVSHLRGCEELLQDFNAREEAKKKPYKTQTKTEIKHTFNSVSLGRSLSTPYIKIIRNGGEDSGLARRSLREGISTDVMSGVTTMVTPGLTLRIATDGKSKGTTSSRVTVSKTNAADVVEIPKTDADDEDHMSPYVFLLFVLIIVVVLFYIYRPL